MLKPNAKKVTAHNETAQLVAQFVRNGGLIQVAKLGVAGSLKKRKYIKSAA